MKNPIHYFLKTEIWPFLILLATVGLSLWAYPLLPDVVASHWGFSGQADGWSSRQFHCLFFPALIFGLYFLLSLMPKLDPRSERYAQFSRAFLIIRDIVLLFMFFIFVTATLANLGYKLNIGVLVSTASGLLLIVMGNYLGKVKSNFFIGIRTPWTLSSENVWNRTNRLMARLFIIFGLIIIVAPWLPFNIAAILFGLGVAAIMFGPLVYSYILFDREKKDNNHRIDN
jgi:uncharacterized membrane protein